MKVQTRMVRMMEPAHVPFAALEASESRYITTDVLFSSGLLLSSSVQPIPQTQLFRWGALFCNRGMLAVPTSDQVPSSNSTVAAQISSDTDRSQNIPLANDTSPRYRQPNQDDVVTSFGGNTRVESYGEGGSKEWNSESPVGVLVAKVVAEVAYVLASEDEEDVCPTCLEEYTEENPRINTKCSHHYHLGCIYEWMERKETCPVCGKVASLIMFYGELAPVARGRMPNWGCGSAAAAPIALAAPLFSPSP
ncbi:hypothetical protein RJ640_008042 [Escallonia rubra]|uniref:RING-type E3 ubiquitin transferase n=1 Tax=Escallonia rubra TaxID=112253 RepID=A0AA88QVY1_9ASTE|nr:hypothetical protein RJ640_008042 [Escallonia rubra]